jgi:4-coumarate--CoA ligase (photoactive yellow protein activation family)
MSPPARSLQSWWRTTGALERFVGDLIDAEIRILRPGGPWPQHLGPTELAAAVLDENGLGFDSLERIALAAALSERLQLHRGGLTDTLLVAPLLGDWLQAAAASLERFSETITLRSSGSSGRRRACSHPRAALEAEAAFWQGELPGRRRLCSAVASHHIYGLLFTQMLPAAAQIPVEDLRPLSPGAVMATLRPGDLVIGHPVFWEALLRATAAPWPQDILGVTSGAGCPEALLDKLREAGLAGMVDVYGSSETAGIGWRTAPGPHRLLPWWKQAPGGLLLSTAGLPVQPPDQLHWDSGGGFRIGERQDGAVMIGGTVVDLDRVRSVLRAHPGIAEAAVRPMTAAEGSRLKAFLVAAPGAGETAALLQAITRHVDSTLTTAERPRAYRFGNALPQTPNGKPADWTV